MIPPRVAKTAKLRSDHDRYKAALEKINKLPGGSTVKDLEEIRFKAVNIAFKALTG